MPLQASLRRRWRAGLLAVLLLMPLSAAADTASEESLKAGFILNFARFADWPAGVVAGGQLRICSLGAQPLGGNLIQLQGRQLQGREVQVRLSTRSDDWRDCHVLFIPASEGYRQDAVLRTLAQSPTLTVSDSPDFAQAGGMIGFKQRAGRIRFDINLGSARRAGLNLSSNLLKLADEVLQ